MTRDEFETRLRVVVQGQMAARHHSYRDLVRDVAAALEDSERLDWLAANGVGVTGGFPSLSKAHLQRGDEFRREIDRARATRSGRVDGAK